MAVECHRSDLIDRMRVPFAREFESLRDRLPLISARKNRRHRGARRFGGTPGSVGDRDVRSESEGKRSPIALASRLISIVLGVSSVFIGDGRCNDFQSDSLGALATDSRPRTVNPDGPDSRFRAQLVIRIVRSKGRRKRLGNVAGHATL